MEYLRRSFSGALIIWLDFWRHRIQDLSGLYSHISFLTGTEFPADMAQAKASQKLLSMRDLNLQSIEIPNTDGARQSTLVSAGGTCSIESKDNINLLDVIAKGSTLSGNGPCLGYRGSKPEYKWLNYNEVIERSENIASGLIKIGMTRGQTSFLAIYSQNCVEWVLTEYACYNQSVVTVPLYDTLGPNACSFILNQTESRIVACDKEERAKSIILKASCTPSLEHLIVFNGISDETKKMAQKAGIKLHQLLDIEVLGKENPQPKLLAKSQDLCTICYTSGTTGDPKGVMLTHGNMINVAIGTSMHLGEYAPTLSDVYASILPLAHMMERSVLVCYFMNGARCGFYRGDIKYLMDDLKALKPTMMAVVPRILNRIYDRVYAQVNNNKIKKYLLNLALEKKTTDVKKLIIRKNSLWDRLVFKKISDELGGCLRLLMSGGAPASEKVLAFSRCSLGCMVLEGYGQTETGAACALGTPWDMTPGQVGPPSPCCHIKLVDVPDMEYFAENKQGEICVRGGGVFKGYFKMPKETSEALDADGWLHTGDIGEWLQNGSLRLIDRKKHIFKLSQGEYIAPEKIENVYLCNKYVNQIFVYGESLWSALVSIVIPDQAILESWCKEKGISGSWEEICKNQVVKQFIFSDMVATGRAEGLKSFEQVKGIHLHSEPFTIDNGFLTPTSKIKRSVCQKHFLDRMQTMYRKSTETSKP